MRARKEVIKMKLHHEDGTLRWEVEITKEDKIYEIHETMNYSLFGTLGKGNTPGEALDNFLSKEEELLKSL